MISAEEMLPVWKAVFGATLPKEAFFSPGRINLIGEHIDYNGGLVMPAAISLGVTALFLPDGSRKLTVFSVDFDERVIIDADANNAPEGKMRWPVYIFGVLKVLQDHDFDIRGGKLLLQSDLPTGAGLSSSAAIECLTAFVMQPQYFNVNRRELAYLAQEAEHQYAGVKCGIMDQYAVANGKKGFAMVLNCAEGTHADIPLSLGDYQLVIIQSNYQRTLADSKYNERLAECRKALALLQKTDPAQHLVDVHPMSLVQLEDDVLYLRAKHVVNEQNRVIAAYEALLAGQLQYFGALLYASHQSLDEDYEVAGDALNAIVHYAQKASYCIGARMTGAGFGGCCIALVQKDKVKRFSDYVGQKYREQTGLNADFYIAETSDGVGRLENISYC